MTIQWRKSTHSGGAGGTQGDCVELASLDTSVGIRDSKDPQAPHLDIGREALATLLTQIKAGELDL